MKLRLRAIPAMAAAALLLTGLGACSGSASAPAADSGGSGSGAAAIAHLTGGDVNFYSDVDPNKTQGCNDNYCGLFMEHLLQLGPGNTLEPELATSVSQPNPVTYVYHLRHGVTFWDGSPMTSADVVYSLDYQSKPGVPTSVYFANSLSYEGVIFEKAFALAHPATMGNPGVLIEATGPWEIKSLDPTRGMELTVNPRWWGGKVPVQQISVKFFSTETSEALAMRSGEIDVAFPQQVGITLKVQETSVTKWIADAGSAGTPPGGGMYISLGAVSPDPSILPSYMVGTTATYNTAHYAPAAADSLLAQGLATSDKAKRLAVYGQLLKQVATDVPYVPLFSSYSFTALSSKYTLPRSPTTRPSSPGRSASRPRLSRPDQERTR
jgi:ABC-type transport system substrate-binding protein